MNGSLGITSAILRMALRSENPDLSYLQYIITFLCCRNYTVKWWLVYMQTSAGNKYCFVRPLELLSVSNEYLTAHSCFVRA